MATIDLIAPNGLRIIGTAETIPGVAKVLGWTVAAEGTLEPEYAGDTDVDWDGQLTDTDDDEDEEDAA